jgi:hypothetical protein
MLERLESLQQVGERSLHRLDLLQSLEDQGTGFASQGRGVRES